MIPDDRLVKLVTQFRCGILEDTISSKGMCMVVCWPLQSFLHLYGVNTKLVTGEYEGTSCNCEHVWLELEDGRILDPTADQFGLAPVYLGPLPKRYRTLEKRACQTGVN